MSTTEKHPPYVLVDFPPMNTVLIFTAPVQFIPNN